MKKLLLTLGSLIISFNAFACITAPYEVNLDKLKGTKSIKTSGSITLIARKQNFEIVSNPFEINNRYAGSNTGRVVFDVYRTKPTKQSGTVVIKYKSGQKTKLKITFLPQKKNRGNSKNKGNCR
ncbi:MAG TPA: hypothetical protein DCL21_03170 [Alphaproteobacteria bacterium]|nr:hypothetical protein [Alphaproteobacteria bacterium]